MTQRNDDQHAMEHLRSQIRSAFPNVAYSGPITAADKEPGEDYDDTRALYEALHGRTWSEIPLAFIRANPDGTVLLTPEAFVVYLPAWLIESLPDPDVAEQMVYTFCPDDDGTQGYMATRIQRLTPAQNEAVRAFLTHQIQVARSQFVRDYAQRALAYVGRFCNA